MIRIQSILATTDFSTDARYAAERTAIICSTIGIPKGAVLHVMEASWLDTLRHFVDVSAEVKQNLANMASQTLDHLVVEIRQHTGFNLEPKMRAGNPLDVILETSLGFDLIALGARGKHPIREFVVGTTAQRLLHKTRQPVLVVKHRPARAYQRVLVAVDFSLHSRKAFAYSQAIAPQANIHLVHVFEGLFERTMLSAGVKDEIIQEYRVKARKEAEDEMGRFIETSGLDSNYVFRDIEHGYAPTKLREIAHELEADLVVVGKHGKSIMEELLLGSVTLHLLAESKCDVLVVQ